MPTQVNVYDAKTNLSKLIDRVLAGEEIVIARSGRPVVDLVVHHRSSVRYGGARGRIHFDEDEFEAADVDVRAMFDAAADLDVREPT